MTLANGTLTISGTLAATTFLFGVFVIVFFCILVTKGSLL